MATKVAEAFVTVRANMAQLSTDLAGAQTMMQSSMGRMRDANGRFLPAVHANTAALGAMGKTGVASATAISAANTGLIGSFGRMAKEMGAMMGVMGIGAAIMGGAGAALKFEDSLIKATAAMPDAEAHMEKMSMLARDWGVESGQGAAAAADAIGYLALAGYDAEKSMEALPLVMQFAGAGAFDAATASDILTDAVSALGMQSDDTATHMKNMTHVADLLSTASVTANTSVQQLGEAMLMKAGPAAKNAKVPVEDLTMMLMIFADQGRKGSEAGTLAASTIDGLQKSAAKFANTPLNDIVFDSVGNFKSLSEIVKGLTEEYGALNPEQRKAQLMALGINKQTADGVNLLIGQTAAVEKYGDALAESSGATSELAQKKWASLSQQLGVLKARMGDVAIAILGPLLQSFVALITPIVKAVQFMARLSERFGDVIPKIIKAAVIAFTLSKSLVILTAAIKGVGLALKVIAATNPFVLLLTAAITLFFFIRDAVSEGAEWAKPFSDLAAKAGEVFEQIKQKAVDLWTSFMETMQPAIDAVVGVWNSLVGFFQQVVDTILGVWGDTTQTGRTMWQDMVEIVTNVFEGFVTLFVGLVEMIKNAWNAMISFMDDLFGTFFGTTFGDFLLSAVEAFAQWVRDVIDFVNLLSQNWEATFAFMKEYVFAIWLKIKNVILTGIDLWVVGFLAILGAWIGIFKAILDYAKFVFNRVGAFAKGMGAGIVAVFKETWAKIKGDGNGQSLGATFADAYNKEIDKVKAPEVKGFKQRVQEEVRGMAGGYIDEMQRDKQAREKEIRDSESRQQALLDKMYADRDAARKKEDEMKDKEETDEKGKEEEEKQEEEKAAKKIAEQLTKVQADLGFKGIQEFGRSIQEKMIKDKDTTAKNQAKDINGIKGLQEQNNDIQMRQLEQLEKNDNGGLA